MNFMDSLKNQWKNYPLRSIILIALALRIFAAIFSQGYGMHDDHFIAIEEPWSWTEGKDYDGWLPGTRGESSQPSIYSFFYPGINYLLFESMHAVGIENPKTKMFFIRLLLGLFSLLTVFYGYKITAHYSNQKNAKQVGLLLALFWFMPFFSVRNLVEVIATPVLLASTWLLIKTNYLEEKERKFLAIFFLSGIVAGISLSIRFQAGIYLAGMGLALLFQKRYIQTLVFAISGLLALVSIQGGLDYMIWGKPFVVLKGYIDYNLANKTAYGNQDNILMYVELIPGLLLPPIGAFLFFGFFLKAKKHLLVFLPSVLFLAFHTYFPNRQERFILTIIPMVIILGVIGWNAFAEKSKWWNKHQKILKACYTFFWVINTILLVAITLTYSKRSRVEAMHYFSKIPTEINSVLIDDTGRGQTMMMPVFYAGKAFNVVTVSEIDTNDTQYYNNLSYMHFTRSLKIFDQENGVEQPEYIVFVEDINLNKRIEIMKTYYPDLKFEAYISPSLTDRIMKKLNPNNKNEDFYIYKTGL
jgi:hypothetical protein